jgi:hypothetical protein
MVTPARIFTMILGLTIFTGHANACLRDTLDVRAVQWSDLIVCAKLVEAGKVTEIDRTTSATTAPTTAPALPPGTVAPEGFVVATFEVIETIDGATPAGAQPIRVLRMVSPSARPASCTASLSGKHTGDSFILLLRRCDQTELAGAPANAIPQEVRKEAFVVVHAIAAAEADAGAIADLKQMIQDVRHAEAGATDDTIQPQVDAVANAADETEAEDAQKTLLELGPKALPALRTKMDDASVRDSGRSRVRRMIEELAAPALGAEAP